MAILKALMRGGEILIFDEPTGLPAPQEAEGLFEVCRWVRTAGHTVIFITHKLREVMDFADRVTVLRQGQVVAIQDVAKEDQHQIARHD